MSKIMKKLNILFILCFTASTLFAQDSVYKSIELSPTYIRATNPNLETKVINSGVELTMKNIKKLNMGMDVPYILNQTPSVVVGSDAGTGIGYTNIRIRGTDISRINVNMNGIPINDAEGQGVFFVNFPDILASANSLTIERGVGSSRAGYGNFGGAISINNLDVNYKKPTVSFNTDFGSFNTLRTMAKASTGLINNRFITTLRLSRIVSDGYIDRSASKLQSGQITAKYLLSPTSSLTFNYLGGKERTQQAWNGVAQENLDSARTFNELGSKGDGTFYDNQTDNYQQDYYQLFYDKSTPAKRYFGAYKGKINYGGALFYTKGKGYYEEYKLGQSYGAYALPNFVQGNDTSTSTDIIRQLWLDNDFYGGRAYVNYLSEKFDAGLYLNVSEYKGDHFGDIIWAEKGIPNDYRWYNLNASKNDKNIYGMLSYKLKKNLSVFADLQVRNVNYEINGFRDNPSIEQDLSWTFFNPKIELRYAPSYKNSLSLFVARSSKEPNRDDFEAGVNNVPKAEKITNVELNYNHKFYRFISLYSTFFYMGYQDQLVLTGQINDVGAYARTNVDNSYRAGIELMTKIQFNKKLNAQANVSFSQNKIGNFTEFIDDYDNGGQLENDYTNTDISFSPNVIAGAQISYYPLRGGVENTLENLSIDLMPKYVGQQFLDNTENEARSIDAFTSTDLIINAPLNFDKKGKLNLRAGLYNVFNSLYETNGYTFSYIAGGPNTFNYLYPQAGFRFMFGIGVEF